MEYLMEDVNVLKLNKNLQQTNIYVKHHKIHYMKENPYPNKGTMKMNLASYLLTPGHVMLLDMEDHMPFQPFKTHLTLHYLKKGCTSLLCLFSVERERDFGIRLKKARTSMLNSPLDFYFAIRIPIRKLTTSLLRQCKRHKIAAVFLELEDETELHSIPWGWIKDALYQFPITFLPCLRNVSPAKRNKKKKEWNMVMKNERLSHSRDCPKEAAPLEMDLLMKIGIYPSKGDLRVGGELDYNLYLVPEGHIIETIQNLDYDSHIPEVTVHNGTIIHSGNHVLFRPGFGKECKVSVPGHFLLEKF
ncbi:hypothetical protein FIU87_12095 [Bacillus sp. THAF10]|uniref:hypothetical protein n=1 Tax=Bacillus sp. THAF10 TaxID=2587848 RepID=UPI001267FE11|nr:hypothetical protein [Bacillus sp. THAF10]QFT89390.1 hypothetical protein FIU87_12095 [Bacillus sp. THAF10]